MKYLSLLLFALCISNVSFAENQGGYYEITHLYVWTNGDAHVWFERAGDHNCSDRTYPNRYLLSTSSPRYEAKYALLLLARVAAGKVNMNYTCKNGLPYIDAIRY